MKGGKAIKKGRGEFRRAPCALIFRMNFFLVQLCAGRDVVIDHQQVQAFFTFLGVDGGDQHAAGVDAHHLAWWEVDNSDAGLADQLLRLIVVVDAAEDGAVGARAVVQGELQQLLGLWNRDAVLDLDRAEVGLGERLEVHIVLEQWLDLDVGEVDDFFLLGFCRSSFALRCVLLRHVERLHRREYYLGIIVTSHKFL